MFNPPKINELKIQKRPPLYTEIWRSSNGDTISGKSVLNMEALRFYMNELKMTGEKTSKKRKKKSKKRKKK